MRLDIDWRYQCDRSNTNNNRNAQFLREGSMLERRAARLLAGLVAAVTVLGMAVSVQAQEKKIKIGVIYDLTRFFFITTIVMRSPPA